MNFLSKDESWNLLHKKLFSEEHCPLELEEIGKKIAKNCGGLPLAIHAISGVLSHAKRSQESWMQIAKDASSAVAEKDELILKILSLSYNNLPNHLKPCFLYMAAFPEDYEIRASKVIRLCVAEGFLQPIPNKSSEEVAETYLQDLVNRNLLFVRRRETNEKVKSYGMHDLLRDLCVRKAEEDKFLNVCNLRRESLFLSRVSVESLFLRRVSVHTSYVTRGLMESMTVSRSFLCIGIPSVGKFLSPHLLRGLRLLRVLDILTIEFGKFPKEVLQLVHLRYLACTCQSYLPSSISILWNLETIIFRQISGYSSSVLPATYEIFDIPRLRHVKFKGTPPHFDLHGKNLVLQENLQTLSTIHYRGSDRIFESVPNLKKLGIFGYSAISSRIDLTSLSKLETIKCSSDLRYYSRCYLPFIIFPHSLKKVTLCDCLILSDLYMNKLGILPNLQVLKLRNNIFWSPIWKVNEGEFGKLQVLLLEKSNLEEWVADETNFPILKSLVIRQCSQLKRIPCGIGEISTLEIVEVHDSSRYVAASARQIEKEQLELGNYDLQVRISHS